MVFRQPLGGVQVVFGWCLGVRGVTDLGAVARAVPARVVEQRPAKPLPQQLPVLPQLLWALARPPATPLQVKLQLPLPARGGGAKVMDQ